MTLLTTAQVAARLGINPSRVRQLAIEHNIGTLITPRTRVFTEEEAAMINAARNPIGRPKFNPATIVTDLLAQDPEPEPTIAELAAQLVNTGVVTDPGDGAQTVAVTRSLYDRFVAALDAAPASELLTIACRTLIAFADAGDEMVDFPLPAFDRFAAGR